MFLFPPPSVVCFHSSLSWFFSLLPQLFFSTLSSAVLFHSSSFHCCFSLLPLQLFLVTPPSVVPFHYYLSCYFLLLLQLFLFTPPTAGSFHSSLFSAVPFHSSLFSAVPFHSTHFSFFSLFSHSVSLLHLQRFLSPPALAVPFHFFLWLFFYCTFSSLTPSVSSCIPKLSSTLEGLMLL
jgi:hypothetical protein